MAEALPSFAPRLEQPIFERLALIGIGLIGSSIARAARELNLAHIIVAADSDPHVRQRLAKIGIADQVHATVAEAVRDADHVILCVPVGVCGAVTAAMAAALKPGDRKSVV